MSEKNILLKAVAVSYFQFLKIDNSKMNTVVLSIWVFVHALIYSFHSPIEIEK